MRREPVSSIFKAVAILLLLGANNLVGLAGARADTINAEFQYAAKVTCSLLGTFGDGFLANGIYRTLINIHNPTEKKIVFARKVAIAGQIGDDPGGFGVTPYKSATFERDGAVAIDCGGIAAFFCPTEDGLCIDFSAIDGFLIINSPIELDVIAIYTARPREGEVATMDIENIKPRKIRKTIKTVEAAPTIKERIRKDPF